MRWARAGRRRRRCQGNGPRASPAAARSRQGLFNNRLGILLSWLPAAAREPETAHGAANEARRLWPRAPPPGFSNPAPSDPSGEDGNTSRALSSSGREHLSRHTTPRSTSPSPRAGRAEERAMADNLRRLVSNEALRSLQDKLESWLREYNVSQRGRPPGFAPLSSSSHNPQREVLRTGLRVTALPSPAVLIPLWDPHRGKRGNAIPFSPSDARWRGPRSAGLVVAEESSYFSER